MKQNVLVRLCGSLAVVCSCAVVHAGCGGGSDGERMEVLAGQKAVVVEACQIVHGANDPTALQQCIDELYTPSASHEARIAEEGDDDEKLCLQLGGVNRNKVGPCKEALVKVIRSAKQEDGLLLAAGLLELGHFCPAEALCAP